MPRTLGLLHVILQRAMENETRLFAPSEQLLEIAEEFVERVRSRESPTVEEYEEKYPELASEIRRYLPMLLPSSSAQSQPDGSPRVLPVAAEHLPTGIHRYQLQRLLGSGSMGAVYQARDLELDRVVAFKIPQIKHNQTVDRFYREARAMATVDHPHICPIYDVGEIAAEDIDDPELRSAVGKPYLTMAYIDGDDLSELLTGPWDPKVAVTMVRKIASALKVAHDAGVVHRDIKPGNIIVDRDFEPYITDFGLARRNLPEEVELTVDGQILGSPAYMSPEQINARPDLNAQADIYSLGVVLYEMVCGQRPFSGSPLTLLRDICWKEPPSPKEFRAELDSNIEAICLKAIIKDTDQRYASASELIDDLDAWLDGQTIAPPSNAGGKTRGRLKWLVPALCFALLAAVTRPFWPDTIGSPTPVVKKLEPELDPVITISQEEFESQLASNFEQHFRPRTHAGRKPDLSERYAKTFAAYGIDPEATSARSLQTFLATQTPEAKTEILVGLESWLSCILRETEDVPAPWLRSLLEIVHDEHTPLRKALLEMNVDRIGVLAKEYQTKHSDPRLAVIWGNWLQRIDKEIQKDLLFRACEDHPDDVWINLATGRRKRANGNNVGAIRHFEKAIGQRPAAVTFSQLAASYLATKEYELAVQTAQRAIELEEQFAAPHLQLGKARFFMGEYESALESLERAGKLDCDAPAQTCAFQARALLGTGEKGLAMQKAREAIAAFREDDAHRSVARFCREMLNLFEEQDEHGATHHRYKLVLELFAASRQTNNFNYVRPYVDRLHRDLVAMEDGETPRIERLRKMLVSLKNRRGRK